MIDLHTHILPGMDDGAKDAAMSIEMLRQEKRQGVDVVALTPHFYRDRENPEHFLKRRGEAVSRLGDAMLPLSADEAREIPRCVLGAEVAWVPGMNEWDELPELCIGKGRHLLVELPFSPWNSRMIGQLYDLQGRAGVTPIIAHIERYFKIQRPEMIDEILSMGVPIQISADVMLHPLQRGRLMRMFKQGQVHVLASDCHNMTTRKPNLGEALKVIEKKLGKDLREQIVWNAKQILDEQSN